MCQTQMCVKRESGPLNGEGSENGKKIQERENGGESRGLGPFSGHFLHQFVRYLKVGMNLRHVFVLVQKIHEF